MPEILIKGGHGGRIDMKKGQLVEVITVEDHQVCDFFAFNAENIKETLSPAHTRSVLRRIVIRPGDQLWTNLRRPMFEIVSDTVGVHDFCMPQCDPERYLLSFGVADHRSCRHNLRDVMADQDIPYEYLPQPVNLFQPTPVNPDGTFGLLESPALAGDSIVLRALMDVIVAGSACPQDQTLLNKYRPSDIRIVVKDA